MTSGLLISHRRNLELHKLSLLKPETYLNSFIQYINVFNSVLCASKTYYYNAKFTLHAKNPKKTWDIRNELTPNTLNKKNYNNT